MSDKHRFTIHERHAVYTVHNEKCYMCGRPLTMKSMEVDHLIPESLVGSRELPDVLGRLGRASDFDLNGFENWMPACRECNSGKLDLVWEPSLEVQLHLQRAKDRAPEAARIAAETVSKRSVQRALSVLERATQDGTLTDDVRRSLRPLVEYQVGVRDPALNEADEPIRVTPEYEVSPFEILSDDGMVQTARGPYGVGGGPSGGDVGPGMRCGVCGSKYFNGARCIMCGDMSDGD